jgi:hypothetical protein
MKHLFTISGRYSATEDVSITPQVGYNNKINKSFQHIYVSSSSLNVCVCVRTNINNLQLLYQR